MALLETPPSVTRDDEENRYEIRVADVLAGYAEFEPDGHGRLRFTHTEIDPAFRGRGLATDLVAESLADVAGRGEEVEPLCPFVASYLKENDVPGLTVHWPLVEDLGSTDPDTEDS
ncbi:N-acetyltransferase [Microbacterium sp. zg.Y1090]|uniref:GNAT family N-acetyltransferase n=1 Tax=Microbacterium TaxID=33882 RepID=UPI00214CA286|nr:MULTISPECIES: GNAT family N-acetyltransferase [unclassified Microbacterium]MCR2813136.1 N-acetyltransferase [Microbacterium sp. zg.Y1084]MCR2819449.1 N-acetyltransferase [Microbacterium sp. zg.Y1090]MDL5487006.1 GNAT family N-acetyltransferase [Microbacterium sp. zg-Y1211]WIM28425.1 GNAT family N-acetyltransferase [Microbacterium sp. zg-Y1090]